MARRRAAPMYRPIALPSAGSRALRAYETELVVGRVRELEFYDNRETTWWMLTSNDTITPDVVRALPDKPWAASAFRRNPNFFAKDVLELASCHRRSGCSCVAGGVHYAGKPDYTFLDLEKLAFTEGCSLESTYIESRRFASMRDAFGTESPRMSWQLFRKYFKGTTDCLTNPAVANASAIRENPGFPWSARANAEALYKNPAIGAEELAELERLYPGLPWFDWTRYSWSDAVTWDIVERYWDKPWDISGLSRDPKVIDWERLSKYPDGLVRSGEAAPADGSRAWNWKGLSANPAIATWERICEHPDLSWWSEGLSLNKNVCVWEAIAAPPPGQPRAGPACWKPRAQCYVWSKVRFVSDAERAAWARRWMAAWHIQRRWLAAYYTPETRVWRNRMLWEFSGLQGAVGAAGDSAGATRAVAATS